METTHARIEKKTLKRLKRLVRHNGNTIGGLIAEMADEELERLELIPKRRKPCQKQKRKQKR